MVSEFINGGYKLPWDTIFKCASNIIAVTTIAIWVYKSSIEAFYRYSKNRYLDVSKLISVQTSKQLLKVYLSEPALWFKHGFCKIIVALIKVSGINLIEKKFRNNLSNNKLDIKEYLFMNMFIGKFYEITCSFAKSLEYYNKSKIIFNDIDDQRNYYASLIMSTYVSNILKHDELKNIIPVLSDIKRLFNITDNIYLQASLSFSEIAMDMGTMDAFDFSYDSLLASEAKIKDNSDNYYRLKVLSAWNLFKHKQYDNSIKIIDELFERDTQNWFSRKFKKNSIEHCIKSTAHRIKSVALCESKKYDSSIEQMELAIKEASKAKNLLLKAKNYGNYGVILMKNRKYQEADKQYALAISLFNDIFGQNHIHTAKSIGNRGMVQAYLKSFDESERMIVQSIDIYQRVFNNRPHIDLANSYRGYAKMKLIANIPEKALSLFKTSIDMYISVLETKRQKEEAIITLLSFCNDSKTKKDIRLYMSQRYPDLSI